MSENLKPYSLRINDENMEVQVPSWVREYRGHQLDAIERAVGEFRDGSRLVVLDAPTGSGKTLIGETVRQLINQHDRTSYICSTKSLQDQFVKDFPYAKVLKGRGNYPTLTTGVMASDCAKREDAETGTMVCTWCPVVNNCPYERAKREAVGAGVSVLNTAYYLTETNYVGRFRNRPLVIVDEADVLEGELMGFVSLDITPNIVSRYGLGEPDKVTVEDTWLPWAIEAFEKMSGVLESMGERENWDDVKWVREYKRVEGLAGDLAKLVTGLPEGDWVYTGRNGSVSFKPVMVSPYGERNLWKWADKWLLMSATTISPSVIANELGWERGYGSVIVPSTYPIDNRPIKVMPFADMSRKVNDVDLNVRMCQAIMELHPGEKALIHTVNYQLAEAISSGLSEIGNRVFTYTNASSRDRTLGEFKRSKEGVLVAPSMERGVDLPDDDCRVIIIAKVPFPNLGDRQIAKRLYGKGGQTWYNVQTVRRMVQMTGRGIRHADDQCTSYIIDKQFTGLWNKARGLFPDWWKEALNWRERVRV